MRTLAVTLAISVLLLGCGENQKSGPLRDNQLFEFQQYILTHQLSPAEYVISKFVDHDVVFLGEIHRIRDNPLLVQELIPLLYENGVYLLVTEFANASDQPLIDSLISGAEYDEALARYIQMNQYSLWPWQEYLDIYKTAWELNRGLPEGARPFRILGMNCSLDWSVMKTSGDLDNSELRRQVWAGCSEEDWGKMILEQVAAGDKLLVYCGSHHAFTKYRQPVVDGEGAFIRFGDVRVGNHVYDEIGERAMTVFLHSPWYHIRSQYSRADRRPAGGAIDQVMESITGEFHPVGFDVYDSPFGSLKGPETIYAAGYENFKLSDFCDGYVFFRPFAEFEMVTFAEGFYTEDNLDLARQKAPPIAYREASVAQFEQRMRDQVERERGHYRGL